MSNIATMTPSVPGWGKAVERPARMSRIAFLWQALRPVLANVLLAAAPVQAAQFTILHNFDGAHGSAPLGAMALDTAGNLYGTTSEGGKFSVGTLFKLSAGKFTVLHHFRGGTDGATPYGSLMMNASGTLFGTTSAGGSPNAGTVFKRDSSGHYSVLVALDGAAQGRDIRAGLFQDTGGLLYGAAAYGGDPVGNFGTLFKIAPKTKVLTTIHTFLGDDGATPMATLILSNGNLHGTGYGGTLFSIARNGSNYVRIPGDYGNALIVAGQTADANGNFWGVAMVGSSGDQGDIYRIDPTGSFSWVYSFNDMDNHDGRNPTGTLIVGANGLLYGTTRLGGASGCRCGTVFSYNPTTGVRTTLHDFTGSDGFEPWAGLVTDSTGNLYGVTKSGGTKGFGTIFRIQP